MIAGKNWMKIDIQTEMDEYERGLYSGMDENRQIRKRKTEPNIVMLINMSNMHCIYAFANSSKIY